MKFSLVPLTALLAAANAANYIPTAIADITTGTVALNQTVANWFGGPLGLLPIVAKNNELLDAIHDGTDKVTASDPLDFQGAIDVATSAVALQSDVKDTIDTIIRTKHKFDIYLIVSPIIKSNLKKQKAATADFSKALLSKIPADLQPVAEGLIGEINAQFDRGISAY